MDTVASPEGLPLSSFAGVAPFNRLFARLARKHAETKSSTTGHDLPSWVHHVRLTVFTTRILDTRKYVEYVLEFTTDRDVRVLLNQPSCTIAIFGHQMVGAGDVTSRPAVDRIQQITERRGPLDRPDPPARRARLSLTLRLDLTSGRLMELDLSGDVRFRLPRGLVRPVTLRGEHWMTADAAALEVPLGDAIVRLKRGRRPSLSKPLALPNGTFCRIGQSPVIVRLGNVALAGSASKPKIQFRDVHLVTSVPASQP